MTNDWRQHLTDDRTENHSMTEIPIFSPIVNFLNLKREGVGGGGDEVVEGEEE